MDNQIKDWVHLAYQILVILGILGGACTLIFKIGKFVHRIDSLENKIVSKIDGLEDKIKEISEDIRDIKSDIKNLNSKVSHIEGHLFGISFKTHKDSQYSFHRKEQAKQQTK